MELATGAFWRLTGLPLIVIIIWRVSQSRFFSALIKPILLRASMRLRLLGRQALTRSLDFYPRFLQTSSVTSGRSLVRQAPIT